MSIDPTGIFPTQPQTTGTESASAAERGNNSTVQRLPDATGSTAGDTLTLTPQAAQLKAVEDNLSQQSVIDGARVENLRSAIDAGSYKINPMQVAEKFIEFESSFLQGPSLAARP